MGIHGCPIEVKMVASLLGKSSFFEETMDEDN
jgi:hypothetical protein